MEKYRGMSSGQLRNEAEEINGELRRRAYAEGYEQGRFDAEMDSGWKDNINPPTIEELLAIGRKVLAESTQESLDETAQEARDRIVRQAKEDVEELTEKVTGHGWTAFPATRITGNVIPRFIINKRKRTVVTILELKYIGGIVEDHKGIAKANPSDCFNVYIGKAIAIRRALGLDVPDEYINTPQPTEVRAGDIVDFEGYKVEMCDEEDRRIMGYTEGTARKDSIVGDHGKIIDDSREEESEGC